MKNRKLSFLFAVSFLFLVIGWSAMVPQVLANERKISTPIENGKITTFKEFNGKGYNIGDDYFLANYTNDIIPYWKNLAKESNRIHLEQIGFTSGLHAPLDGTPRPMFMAIITSPDNWKKIDKYKKIAKQLATAEGLTDDAARDLASKGKAIVSIDAGMHATEMANPQAMTLMLYEMASQNDEETLRILEDVIILAMCSNPDGLDLVSNWYMNDHLTGLPQTDPLKRSYSGLPVLYQKYVEHDNNRDYYTVYMPEAQAISRVFYKEWFPQFHYCQHQGGPTGEVLFIGAVRDPINPNIDMLMNPSLELFSAAVHQRFVAEGKYGATCRTGANYSLWHNGMVRSGGTFHNVMSILSEITGDPTPTRISFAPTKLINTNDTPFPSEPQPVWHFSQCMEWLHTAYRGFFDLASRERETLLFNVYRMGMNSIKKGSKDNWTWEEGKLAAFNALPSAQRTFENLKTTANRDPRGFIVPSDQIDFSTAIKLINMLQRSGAIVLRATQDFAVGGKNYPSGSLIVKTAQAYRAHVMDAFQEVTYPNDIKCVGQPPTAPYDVAGYTMALQTGIKYDKIYEGFDGPFEKVKLDNWDGAKWTDEMKPPAGVAISSGVAGYLLSHAVNDSFIAVNRLMKNGAEVYWLKTEHVINGKTYPAGTMYIPSTPSVLSLLQGLAAEKGLNFEATASKPAGAAFKLQPMRIGLANTYGGNSTEGWTEFMLSQFEFPIQLVYPLELNAGNLAAKYDVLIFEAGFIPATTTSTTPPTPPDPALYAPQFRNMIGSISAQTTVPKIIQFMNDGGTVVTIGSSTRLGYYPALALPIKNHLVDSTGKALTSTVFYIPGSVLDARLDTSLLINYGMPERPYVFFDGAATFDVTRTGATGIGISDIAWYDSTTPTKSGWGWGQAALLNGVAAIQAQIGDGLLYMFGTDIDFRAQPHGNYKWLFNGIYIGGLTAVTL
jgi:hypothetical protein